MGSPTNASSSRSFTDRQAMGSAASTAKTTPRASAVRGAGRDFTGTETETAACPAIVTPKVLSVFDVTTLGAAAVSQA
jgi:hypothetical protein